MPASACPSIGVRAASQRRSRGRLIVRASSPAVRGADADVLLEEAVRLARIGEGPQVGQREDLVRLAAGHVGVGPGPGLHALDRLEPTQLLEVGRVVGATVTGRLPLHEQALHRRRVDAGRRPLDRRLEVGEDPRDRPLGGEDVEPVEGAHEWGEDEGEADDQLRPEAERRARDRGGCIHGSLLAAGGRTAAEGPAQDGGDEMG